MSSDRRNKNIMKYVLGKEGTKKKKKSKKRRRIERIIILVAAAIVLGFAFVVFMFQTVKMVGPSMQGTIEDGETVIVSKIGKLIHGVKRDDIVAVKKNSDKYYSIKRVVAVPGDKVKIDGGKLYINGSIYELKSGDIIVNPGIRRGISVPMPMCSFPSSGRTATPRAARASSVSGFQARRTPTSRAASASSAGVTLRTAATRCASA